MRDSGMLRANSLIAKNNEEIKELRQQVLVLQQQVESQKEYEQALVDCLNGSSKAKYSAEVFDKERTRITADVAKHCIEIAVDNHLEDDPIDATIKTIRKEYEVE